MTCSVSIEFGRQRHTVPQEVANELANRASIITQLKKENEILQTALGEKESAKALAPVRPAAPKANPPPAQAAPTKVEQQLPAPTKPNPVQRTGATSPFKGAPKRT